MSIDPTRGARTTAVVFEYPKAGAPCDASTVRQMVVQRFRQFLRRDPDDAGLEHWTRGASEVAARRAAADQVGRWLDTRFRESDEYIALNLTDDVYEEVLCRRPGDRGHWHERAVEMRNEGATFPDIRNMLRRNLSATAEYRLMHVDAVVDGAHRSVLRRTPEAPGYWHDVARRQVMSGRTLEEVQLFVEANLRQTEEFRLLHVDARAGILLSDLLAMMPTLPAWKAEAYLPQLSAAMAEAEIDTPLRKAAFLAHLAHESHELRLFEAPTSGVEYEDAVPLGNVRAADGVRFKPRGPLGLTGRLNYRAAGAALGLALEEHPARAAEPEVAFRVAAWWWASRGMNALADTGCFDRGAPSEPAEVKARRQMYYGRARSLFGA